MWILPFVLVVLICQKCSLAGPIGCDSKEGEVTLDLSSPDPSLFSLADEELSQVIHKRFNPKDGCYITSIVDDGSKVWTGTDERRCKNVNQYSREGYSSLLVIDTKDETLHFEKNDDEWNEVTLEVFNEKLHHMKNLPSSSGSTSNADDGRCEGGTHFNGPPQRDKEQATLQNDKHTTHHVRKEPEHEPKSHVRPPQTTSSDSKEVELDIMDIGGSLFEAIDSTEEGVPLKKLYPKDDHRLTEVKDGQETIWEATNYTEFGKSVWAYYEGSSPLLATIRFVKSDGITDVKYYKLRGKWTQVTKEDHDTALTSMKSRFSLSRLNVKLDICTVDKNMFTIQDSSEDGVPTKTFTPEKTYRLTDVSDGQEAIWKAYSSKQHCLSALTYYDATGGPILATVTFVKADRTTVSRCYIKQDGTWKWVDKEDFDASLTKMKKDVILSKIRAKLDVSSIDENLFIIHDSLNEDVLLKTVTPKTNSRLVEVSDGNLSIWKPTNYTCFGKSAWFHYDATGAPILATVTYMRDDGNTACRYYVKQDNGTWEWVNKTVHDEKLISMKRLASLAKVKDKLDLTDIYGSLFDIKYFFDGRVPIRHITPKEGHRITAVFDGQEPIWTTYSASQYCKSVRVYYDVNTPLLATVQFVKGDGKTDFGYYVKQADGTWKLAEKTDFDERLEGLKKPFPTSLKDDTDLQKVEELLSGLSLEEQGHLTAKEPTIPVVLDLVVQTNPAIDVREVISDDGVKSTYYYQLGKIFFSVILDDSIEVWKAEEEEKCILAYTICRDHKTYLYLLVKNGHTTSFVEYEKGIDGVWTKVDRRKTPPVTRTPSSLSLQSLQDGDSVYNSAQDDKVAEDVLLSESSDSDEEEFITPPSEDVSEDLEQIPTSTPEVQDVTSPSPTDSRETTLDIASPNSSSIDTFTRMPYEMVQTIYTAKNGYRIASVIESGREIWKAPDGHSCSHVNVLTHGYKRTHMNIYVRDKEGTMNVLYYAKDDEEWNTIEEDAFYRRFHIEAVKGSVIETIALDIKAWSDPTKFYITRSLDFPFSVYAPNVGYRIEKVGYSTKMPPIHPGDVEETKKTVSTIIWSAQSEYQGCLYVSLYPMYDHKLAYMIIHTSGGLKELYYSKSSGSWKSVERDAYLKDLENAGFNRSTFTNEITADLSRPDEKTFRIKEYNIGNDGIHLYTARIGFRLRTIVDGEAVVWTASGDERCTYMNQVFQKLVFQDKDMPFKDKKPIAFFILIDDPKGNRNVLYFFKSDDTWKNVTKSEYHALMPIKVNALNLPRMENQKITMSSFRNKKGLKIISYASTVENPKADIILCHGIRSHFMSEFGTANVEWNFERFGSPPFPYINGIFLQESSHKRNLVNLHRHIFEHGSLDGMDASLVQPGYEYEGSLIEFFNKLGYNVYGFDLQSHGLSEAQTENKCHVHDFKDYLHDALQFISIVKRGAFGDPTEKWNDATVFQNMKSHRKTILHANSMGGNIVIQAVQEFYRNVKNPQAKLVDDLIVTSGMFNIDHYLDLPSKKAAKWWIENRYKEDALAKTNTYETPLDYGESFDLFVRHREPLFKTSGLTFKTTLLMFNACDDVKKEENMAYYPKNLPTILFHSKDDLLCDVKGPRELMDKYFKENKNVKFIELDSSFHYLTIPQAMVALQSQFKEWLDKYTAV